MTTEEATRTLNTIREDIEMLKEAVELGNDSDKRAAIGRVAAWAPKLVEAAVAT
ncbi:hypothetical protein [Neoaquamicrobium sediminum]|uniref:hypothetical protein n=1 Tax=Neoaquamicrobium sediminum TaxID=1849104 RepID=UPI003BAAAE62